MPDDGHFPGSHTRTKNNLDTSSLILSRVWTNLSRFTS